MKTVRDYEDLYYIRARYQDCYEVLIMNSEWIKVNNKTSKLITKATRWSALWDIGRDRALSRFIWEMTELRRIVSVTSLGCYREDECQLNIDYGIQSISLDLVDGLTAHSVRISKKNWCYIIQ